MAMALRPLRHTAHGNRAKSAKKSKSRGEIDPFVARFPLAGRRLAATVNQPFEETPGQDDVLSLAASSPHLERPKISPRFRFFGNFRPSKLRKRFENSELKADARHAPRPALVRPMRATLPADRGFPARCFVSPEARSFERAYEFCHKINFDLVFFVGSSESSNHNREHRRCDAFIQPQTLLTAPVTSCFEV